MNRGSGLPSEKSKSLVEDAQPIIKGKSTKKEMEEGSFIEEYAEFEACYVSPLGERLPQR